MIRFVRFAVDLSLVYFSLFVVLLCLSALGVLKTTVPDASIRLLIFDIFGYSFYLYWIYIILVMLKLMGVHVLDKKRMISIIVPVLIATILYFSNQLPLKTDL